MNPAHLIHGTNVVSMLGQRLERWPSIEITLGPGVVVAAAQCLHTVRGRVSAHVPLTASIHHTYSHTL